MSDLTITGQLFNATTSDPLTTGGGAVQVQELVLAGTTVTNLGVVATAAANPDGSFSVGPISPPPTDPANPNAQVMLIVSPTSPSGARIGNTMGELSDGTTIPMSGNFPRTPGSLQNPLAAPSVGPHLLL